MRRFQNAIQRRWQAAADSTPARFVMRPYLQWRWRRSRQVVCITPGCYRMCGQDYLCHCAKHGPTYE